MHFQNNIINKFDRRTLGTGTCFQKEYLVTLILDNIFMLRGVKDVTRKTCT